MHKEAIMKISRHRMNTDGKGVSTLIGFPGCPLKCHYCLNEHCHSDDLNLTYYTSDELVNYVKIDDIFFRMTGGGLVFGGGEPILHSSFIKDVILKSPEQWDYRIETSLNCSWEHIERLLPYIRYWIIDVKDMNPIIYQKYTGASNDFVVDNILKLSNLVDRDKIHFRVPHIQGYNNDDDVEKSINMLSEIGLVEEFVYRVNDGRE